MHGCVWHEWVKQLKLKHLSAATFTAISTLLYVQSENNYYENCFSSKTLFCEVKTQTFWKICVNVEMQHFASSDNRENLHVHKLKNCMR